MNSEPQRCNGFLFCAAIFCLMLLRPDPTEGGGPIHGAKSSGMGTAFTAAGDDPSVIAVNPAGLVRSQGTNVYGGTTAVIFETTFTSPAGEKEETDFQIFFPPNLFVTADFGREDLVFGLGLYSPFGVGGRKWSETGLTRYVSTESAIVTINLHPSVAWQILPSVSVGGGFYYMYAISRSERMIDQSPLGAGDGKMEIDTDGDGWGYNFGILWDLSEQVSLGVAYRSKSTVHFDGTVTLRNIAPPLHPLFGGPVFKTGTDTSVTFPEIISIGLAIRPTNRLTVGIDGELVRWSRFDRSDFRFQTQVPEAGFVNGTAIQDWKDAWTYKAGLDYRMTDSLSLRTGYVFVDTQVPEHTLSPDSPESRQHNFCIGAGYRKGSITIDGFYIIGFFADRTVSNHILSGSYENQSHFFGFNIGKRF